MVAARRSQAKGASPSEPESAKTVGTTASADPACEKQVSVPSPRSGVRLPVGRPKGSLDKFPKTVKEMVLGALEQAGGQRYLLEMAKKKPALFTQLVNKIMPTTTETKLEANVTYVIDTGVPDGE